MPLQASALNTDTGGIQTSAEYGDRGDGVSSWFHRIRSIALGGLSDAAVVDPTASGSIIALLKGMLANWRSQNHYPYNATAFAVSSGNVANAAAAAALPATPSVTNYLTGFTITGAGSTGASNILVTIVGTGTTLTYVIAVPAGATVGITPLNVQFAVPLKASAANTAITVSAAAFGAGNTHACATAHGYRV